MKIRIVVSWMVLISCLFMFGLGEAVAQQCHIIRIAKETRGDENRIWLYPREVTVPLDTCLIWVNWVEKEKVNINFHKNSKSCMMASEASSGFKSVAGCFVTDTLQYGQTVSLRFKNKGVFTYQLEILENGPRDGSAPLFRIEREGRIIVE